MTGYIYRYYDSVQDMYYIGQTRDRLKKRDWSHRKGKTDTHSYFDNEYHAHPEQFTLEILETIKSDSKQDLVERLNELEVFYIADYKSKGKKLYNILPGGNQGWKDIPPTQNMLDALTAGRIAFNQFEKDNALPKEERIKRHREAVKRWKCNNPENYKEYYTKQNKLRKDKKHEWYLKNRKRILDKLHEKTKKHQEGIALLNS